jgi:hypothetical protein
MAAGPHVAPRSRLSPSGRAADHGGRPLDFSNERGGGLGALLDAVFARNVRDYLALEAEFKQLFPTVDGFRLHTDGSGNRRVGIRLFDGSEVPAEFMSEGMLYLLAFAILPYLTRSD